MIQSNGQTAPDPVSLDIEREMSGGAAELNMLGQTVMDGYTLKMKLTILWRGLSAQTADMLDAMLTGNDYVGIALDGGAETSCYVEKRALSRRPGSIEYKAVLAER